MNIKPPLYKLACVLFLALSACGTTPVVTFTDTLTVSPASTSTITEMPSLPFPYTVAFGDTCTSIAISFQVSVEEIIELNNLPVSCLIEPNQVLFIPYSGAAKISTPTSFPTRTPVVLPKFPLDDYLMVFPKEDGLYLQDGEKPPVRLAYFDFSDTPKPYDLIFSDDNQRVAFSSSNTDHDVVWMTNTDGSANIGLGFQIDTVEPDARLGAFAFIPGTHQLLVETILCKWQGDGTPCFVNLYIADRDTDEIRKLAYLGLADRKNPYWLLLHEFPQNIVISPNGKMIASGTLSGVTIYALDGKIIHEHILPYEPSSIDNLFPTLSWLPDSSGLVIALPNTFEVKEDRSIPTYTIWRYRIESNIITQICLDPAPINKFEISPDRNWIVYTEINSPYVYLGSLSDGYVENTWDDFGLSNRLAFGPDGKYFFVQTLEGAAGILGSFEDLTDIEPGQPDEFPRVCPFRKWIDARHFTCEAYGRIVIAEINHGIIDLYDLGNGEDLDDHILIKPKQEEP